MQTKWQSEFSEIVKKHEREASSGTLKGIKCTTAEEVIKHLKELKSR